MAFAYHTLDPAHFPITVEAFLVASREVVWSATLTEPESGLGSLYVPPLAKEPIGIRVTNALGEVDEVLP